MKRKPLAQDKEENYESKIEMGEKSVVGGKEKVGQLTFMEDVGVFELGDLLKASAEGLGKGNFGNSYKARLDDGRNVVVKRLRDPKPFTSDEFVKQLEAIADHKHPNLLPLLAFYYSEGEKLLVYKYAPQGNLYNRLHDDENKKLCIPFTARVWVRGNNKCKKGTEDDVRMSLIFSTAALIIDGAGTPYQHHLLFLDRVRIWLPEPLAINTLRRA
ncbi:hypothetical protein RJ640_020105 [Escallonia rubra]|uniref:Protein kinase domain-containing protein n=1 Tax=Escallonia rubra TaxID=112253 RepID=A0AA88R5G2_9ASTE|nr:hypothetical protein RJ640_020105 [Escallonia rubra]